MELLTALVLDDERGVFVDIDVKLMKFEQTYAVLLVKMGATVAFSEVKSSADMLDFMIGNIKGNGFGGPSHEDGEHIFTLVRVQHQNKIELGIDDIQSLGSKGFLNILLTLSNPVDFDLINQFEDLIKIGKRK